MCSNRDCPFWIGEECPVEDYCGGYKDEIQS